MRSLYQGEPSGLSTCAAGSRAGRCSAATPAPTAYVVNQLSNTVTPFSTATGKPGNAIKVGNGPVAIAIQP